MALGRDELFRRYGYHRQGPATAPMFELNRAATLVLADLWDQLLPPGREAACAMTALQEALMWANAAVACNADPNTHAVPELVLGPYLDELLERVEGPELTRSGSVPPRAGPDRPDEAPPIELHMSEWLEGRRADQLEVAQLDAAGTPEQTR